MRGKSAEGLDYMWIRMFFAVSIRTVLDGTNGARQQLYILNETLPSIPFPSSLLSSPSSFVVVIRLSASISLIAFDTQKQTGSSTSWLRLTRLLHLFLLAILEWSLV